MRIAHVILAHKNPAQVARLTAALAHPGVDCYVHVDAKTDITPFLELERQPGVYLCRTRIDVQWGSYSLVQASLESLREAISRGEYDYVNHLSGQDFPLRPASEFYDFLCANQGQEFITCYTEASGVDWWKDADLHLWRHNFHNWRIPGKYRLERLANRFLPRRRFPIEGYTVAGWSQWFTITGRATRYMLDFLDNHPEVVRFFKYVWGADEFVASTVLYNSDYGAHVRENLLYLDWSEGKANPKLLGIADFEALVASEKWFARKFDAGVDARILDRLEAHIAPRALQSPRL